MTRATKRNTRQPRRWPTKLPVDPIKPPSPPPARDAALLALCGEFSDRQLEIDHWNDSEIEWDEGDAANVKWWAALRQIVDTPAQTMEGIKAKAMVLIFTVPGVTASPEIDGELGLSLAADLMNMGAVA